MDIELAKRFVEIAGKRNPGWHAAHDEIGGLCCRQPDAICESGACGCWFWIGLIMDELAGACFRPGLSYINIGDDGEHLCGWDVEYQPQAIPMVARERTTMDINPLVPCIEAYIAAFEHVL